jgi:Copper amine oxidase, enzyme domain
MTARRVLAGVFLAAAGLFAFVAPSAAQPACNLAGEHLMSWPDDGPVWQFCWMRPVDSSGTNGSGLEIRNVYYNGHLVLKRGHIPMLNVEYVQKSCGCDCYRDWEDQQDYFSADHIVTPHVYAEPTIPAQTVCDVGGGNDVCSPGQLNCFDGVAAEKFADPLVLTTQFEAGWYRYTMRWKFYLDGRIQPIMGFSAVSAGCVSCTHKHHAYWRFDFDVDGVTNIVTEAPNPAAPPPGGRGGPRPRATTLTAEGMRLTDYPGISWLVTNPASHRSYRLVPGPEASLPADDFSEGDLWALKYHANEIDDGHGLGDCPVDFAPWLNGESLNGDVVLWYRSGWLHVGGDLADCDPVGPTLYPVGDWSP